MWSSLMSSVKHIDRYDLIKSSAAEIEQFVSQFQNNDESLLDAINSIQDNLIQVDGFHYPKASLLTENNTMIGILYGNHVGHLNMSNLYLAEIEKVPVIETNDAVYIEVIEALTTSIVKEKDSTLNKTQVLTLKSFREQISTYHLDDIFCLDVSRYSKIRLFHLSSTRHFKKIKNYYSSKWNMVVSMKDFQIHKLYYKKYLLIGFTLYRKEDGEEFFFSDQYQEVLECIETNNLPFGDSNYTMDSLLDKINTCDYEGLTQLERDFLKKN